MKTAAVTKVVDFARAVLWIEGLIFLLAIAIVAFGIPAKISGIITYYALTVLVLGVAAVVKYKPNRLLLGIVLLLIADRAVASSSAEPGAAILLQPIALLLPLNLLGLSWLEERGALTRAAAFGFGAIVVQMTLVALVASTATAVTSLPFSVNFLPAVWLDWTPISQPAFIASMGVLVVLFVKVVREPIPATRGLLWGTACAVLALLSTEGTMFFFASAILVMTVAAYGTAQTLAATDELTELPDRPSFDEALTHLRKSYSIALVGVDGFKDFNEKYGEETGDQVLRRVGFVLAEIGGGGTGYRYGVDEFAVIFPGKDIDDVHKHLDSVRTQIGGRPFGIRATRRIPWNPEDGTSKPEGSGKKVLLTVSIGVTERGGKVFDPVQVVGEADQALYKARRAGGNRVAVLRSQG